ncbi:MAG TPA: VCBS repeat-containing protein [Thermoleophilia bacterium]|nr:VCBS repeat-containing protein [Thermoleophilia bacterium]
MGTLVTLRQAAARSTAHHRLPLLLALILALGLFVYWAAAPAPAGAETMANAAGRYDGLVLRDLGGKRAALVCLVAENGAFTPLELWRSKSGKFDTRKAKFLAGDVNGDGIALYDLGAGRSRLYIWLSDGQQAVLRTAWTSKARAFCWARAKLAVGDLDRDGKDDVIALYDRGRGSAALYRFISTGKAFRRSVGWSGARGALATSGTQLVAGDLTGDGRADAVVLSPRSATSASLLAFVSGSSKFSKKTF